MVVVGQKVPLDDSPRDAATENCIVRAPLRLAVLLQIFAKDAGLSTCRHAPPDLVAAGSNIEKTPA